MSDKNYNLIPLIQSLNRVAGELMDLGLDERFSITVSAENHAFLMEALSQFPDNLRAARLSGGVLTLLGVPVYPQKSELN